MPETVRLPWAYNVYERPRSTDPPFVASYLYPTSSLVFKLANTTRVQLRVIGHYSLHVHVHVVE